MTNDLVFYCINVSIHAPRVGERRLPCGLIMYMELFQSTLPAWGSDAAVAPGRYECDVFQSTLPAWGSDAEVILSAPETPFQSTLPAWGSDIL